MRAEEYRRRKAHRQRLTAGWLLVSMLLVILLAGISLLLDSGVTKNTRIRAFAAEKDLPLDAWPAELIELMEKNPETEEFVLHYPLKKDLHPEIDLSGSVQTSAVPLLLQWDERWGYDRFAGELMGLSGCGSTCLSMVCLYLLDDPALTPRYMAEFAEEEGYSERGSGSTWTLISEGGEKLGLEVEELPLHESSITRELEAGNPIICVMGAGDFTTTGHFIVLTGYADGFVTVNDPNSVERSEKAWELKVIMEQMRNLWVCRTK